jgi:hypothetical protein
VKKCIPELPEVALALGSRKQADTGLSNRVVRQFDFLCELCGSSLRSLRLSLLHFPKQPKILTAKGAKIKARKVREDQPTYYG